MVRPSGHTAGLFSALARRPTQRARRHGAVPSLAVGALGIPPRLLLLPFFSRGRRHPAVRQLLAGLAGLLVVSPALSLESLVSAERELTRMTAAAANLSYRGTATYEQGGALTTLRVVRGVHAGRILERIEYLDGPLEEVIREHGRSGCAGPDPGADPDPVAAIGRAAMIEHYQPAFLDEARIAGRDVVRIRLQPRDHYRYGHLLGIDRQTGLLLQALILDHQGRLLERFQFADIAVGVQIEDPELEPRAVSHRLLRTGGCESGAVQTSPPGWRATWVPPGFVPWSAPAAPRGAEVMHFTDGFSAFSVFIDADAAAVPMLEARRGATVAYVRRFQGSTGGRWICVVGEVPMPTARRIAEGIEPRPEASSTVEVRASGGS